MKKTFPFLFRAKNLALLVLFCLPMISRAQILFTQDFNSSTIVSTYVGSGANQFDFIGVAGTGSSSTYITATGAYANKLSLQRNGNNVAFVRSTDLAAPGPSVLRIKFKLSVPFGTAMASGTAATFYVGSGLTADALTSGELPSNASRHSQIGITITAASTFYLRDLGLFVNTPTYSGEQSITWYINNNGASVNYTDPAGGTSTVANDVADLWVGTTRVLTIAAIPAGAANNLTDFKFLFSNANGNSAIAIDDLEVSTGNLFVLPINLVSFDGVAVKVGVKLNWVTTNEINNNYFELRRAGEAGEFTTIAKINSKGNSQLNNDYNFVDKSPYSGTNYYQLRQYDLDGKMTTFKIISVKSGVASNHIRILTSNKNELNVSVNLSDAKAGNILLTDVSGKVLYTRQALLTAGENIIKIPLKNYNKQLGIVSFITTTERINLKVLF